MSTSAVHDLKDFFTVEMGRISTRLHDESESPLPGLRKDAFTCFENLGFPGSRNEEWKYTNLSDVLNQTYQTARETVDISASFLAELPFTSVKANRVVLINGYYSQAHSSLLDDNSVLGVYSIAQLRKEKSPLLQHISKYAPFNQDAFNALNTALLEDGLFIHVPKKAQVLHPVIVYQLTEAETESCWVQPRMITLVEDHASVQVIEVATGSGQFHSFNNFVSEAQVGANAQFTYFKLQNEEAHASRVDYTRIVQERDSTVQTLTISLRGTLLRNTLHFYLNDQHTTTHLNGLYLCGNNSLIDNHTLVDHAMPHCYSNELYKGIAGSNGQAVFNGKVMVRKDAQKTNAYQRNANVLLSQDAVVNTKPQLEIFADDVKCSHGATTGQIDEEALFYMRSRGIGADVAKVLLMQAFAAEVLTMVTDLDIREEFNTLIENRIATL